MSTIPSTLKKSSLNAPFLPDTIIACLLPQGCIVEIPRRRVMLALVSPEFTQEVLSSDVPITIEGCLQETLECLLKIIMAPERTTDDYVVPKLSLLELRAAFNLADRWKMTAVKSIIQDSLMALHREEPIEAMEWAEGPIQRRRRRDEDDEEALKRLTKRRRH
ncbi:hypothetical protein D9611_007970 [Ephemerocybe angulata]|uniref:Uncharacterized protein n=1 Tax=Ephemerocybe angulata TaxID=980116 RepID=A0A8H5CEW0_9AGAR|nr:hypothetical protein D9611_007970 [Tulosesus angulatus]